MVKYINNITSLKVFIISVSTGRPCHEDVWWSAVIDPRILILGIIWGESSASRPGYFTSTKECAGIH